MTDKTIKFAPPHTPDGEYISGSRHLPGYHIVAYIGNVPCFVEWHPTAEESLRNCARRAKAERAFVMDTETGEVIKEAPPARPLKRAKG